MKNLFNSIINYLGYEIKRTRSESQLVIPTGINSANREIIKICSSYTMTSVERLVALLMAVEYVSKNNISGSFVECGVWKGGSSLAAALKFSDLGDYRDIFLFDTFEGMSSPTAEDIDINGNNADLLLDMEEKSDDGSVWCIADLDTVKKTMKLAENYPEKMVRYIKGKVEETLKDNLPSSISILRLDTDWYESTKSEMEHLFPRLKVGGVLILDDYGHWHGAKKAVNEYLKENGIKILLNRIDYTGRIGVKVA
jgi:hypothetical protein